MLKPWDAIDRDLLSACLSSPSTHADLVKASGCTPNVVKSLVHGYLAAGLVTQLVDGGVRFEVTLTGRARLSALNEVGEYRTNRTENRKAA